MVIATIKQFQIDTLAGNDWVEFLPSLDLGEFAAAQPRLGFGDQRGQRQRHRYWAQRDATESAAGPGSDFIQGTLTAMTACSAMIWTATRWSIMTDCLPARGNDDLFGGVGSEPTLCLVRAIQPIGNAFGRFVDPNSGACLR